MPPGRRTRAGSQAGDWLGKRCGVPSTAPCAPGREGRSGLAPRVPSPVSRPEGGREERAQREGPRSRVGKTCSSERAGPSGSPKFSREGQGEAGGGRPAGRAGASKGRAGAPSGNGLDEEGVAPPGPGGQQRQSLLAHRAPGRRAPGRAQAHTLRALSSSCGRCAWPRGCRNCGPLWGSNCWGASPRPR